MNTFKRKSLYAALAGVAALGVTGAAEAVNVNPDGLGQVLIYPYYTVRTNTASNTFNTLLSVVNSTNSAKVVKVRFLEGKNSREVLDFNLFLSMFDVWTTAIVPDSGGGGRIITADKSCTLPAIPAAGQPFVNYAYSSDGGGSSLDRTKEGYIEIIEMATYQPNTKTYSQITHVNGVPPGCAAVTDSQASADASPISGGLFGGVTIINVLAGSEGAVNATALDNFFNIGFNYQPANAVLPDLTQAAPPISVVFAGTNGVYQSTWGASTADPVSAVLMHDNVLNEYVLDSGTKSGTDWVVTFPTKRFYVFPGTGSAPRLFQRNFNTTVGSCDDVSLNIYDREENTTSTPTSFSPPPPSGVNQLCWEANVVTFNNSNVLASVDTANISTSFQDGWLQLGFFPATITGAVHTLPNVGLTSLITLTGTFTSGLNRTYFGLPTVGAMVQTFQNGTNVVNGVTVLQNYAGAFPHRYTTRIQ